jgi:SAM-dependent methyltransferase
MRLAALEALRCPRCPDSVFTIHHADDTAGEIMTGQLRCPVCSSVYPIDGGIPRFVGHDNYAGSFGLQWLTHRQTQLDSHTGIPISTSRLFETTGWPRDLRGHRVLEAGSGAGRFTEVLATTGANLYSFDYSRAVEANWLNNGAKPDLHLFQGDIFAIPVARASCDYVLCLGVLQHTPDPERAFRSLASRVKPGGRLAIDVYTRSLVALAQWKYLLRPLTTRVNPQRLYKFTQRVVPPLVPLTAFLKRIGGRVGARLSPVVEYSQLGLPSDLNKEWAVLDTFDIYAPAYDLPQSLATVRRWFDEEGFDDVVVRPGINGVIGRGRLAAARR